MLGGDGVTGESGATHNSKANSNFTELYGATAAAQATADSANNGLSTHMSDPTAAHPASAVSFSAGSTGLSSTDVQGALEELAGVSGAADASTTVKGIVELATEAETITGTDTTRAVTPSGVAAVFGLVVKAQSVPIDSQQIASTTGNKFAFRVAQAVTITSVSASLRVAQTSGSIFTIDINKNGTSILSTKLTIDNTEKTSSTAVTPAVIVTAGSANVFAANDEISFDIDQIGDGTAVGPVVNYSGT